MDWRKKFGIRSSKFEICLIVIAAYYIYAPAFAGTWLWDDFEIRANSDLRDWAGLARMWIAPTGPDYAPLKTTVLWAQWHLWRENLYGYHVTNAALHLLGAFLIWHVLKKLGVRFAWLGGLLFVVHPVAVESVAWISELKNTLSLPLLLLAFNFWIDYERWGGAPPRRPIAAANGDSPNADQASQGRAAPPLLCYGCALLFFLAAMLSKSSVVMFPAILLLYAWWRRGRIGWADVRASLPFFAISLVLGLVTVRFQLDHAIAHWNLPKATFPTRIADAGRAIGFYFTKCLFPRDLMPIYPPWNVAPLTLLQFWPWVVIVGVFIVLIRWGGAPPRRQIASANEESPSADQASQGSVFARGYDATSRAAPPKVAQASSPALKVDAISRSRSLGEERDLEIASTLRTMSSRKHGLEARATLFGLGWFLLFLLPVLGFVPMSYQHIAPVADHLCYVPLVGLVGLAAAVIGKVDAASRRVPRRYAAGRGVYLSAIVLALAITSHRYAKIFVNQETMWNYNLEHNDRSPAVFVNLGFILHHDGRLAEAISNYEQAIRLDPDDAQAEDELAGIYVEQNRTREAAPHFDKAIAHYERALRLDPTLLATRRSLAKTLANAGRPSEAIAQYENVLREKPGDAETENNLGKALGDEGRPAEAMSHFETALRLDPNYAEAENSLGLALAGEGRPRAGILHLQEALRLDPDFAEAENNLGFALSGIGRQQEAVAHFEAALRLKPGFGQAENNLGFALAALGRRPEAIAHLERALQLAPDDPKAHYNLAMLLGAAGKTEDAIGHLETAIRLKPDFDAARTELRRLRVVEIATGK